MALIACVNMVCGYERRPVTAPLSFSIDAGDYLCVVGENGAGKSTLLKTILRLQPPLEGEMSFGEGFGLTEIGYLQQRMPIQRDFPASVREVVLSGMLGRVGLRPFLNSEERRVAESNMEKMGILTLQGRCFRELSGGQQQRVLLARALCATKRLLLLDEPVSGLDPSASSSLYDAILRLNREEGVSIMMVSHDVHEALKYATHVLHVGKENFYGTGSEYSESRLGRMYLKGSLT